MSLSNLYEVLRSTDSDAIAQATRELVQIYQDPSSINQLIDLLVTNSSLFIRQQAALGLEKTLHLHYPQLRYLPEAANIKSFVLQLLTNESDRLIRKILSDALSHVFTLGGSSFPECIAFTQELLTSDDSTCQETGLWILSSIVLSLNTSDFLSLTEVAVPAILALLQGGESVQTPVESAASILCSFEDSLPDDCLELYNTLLEFFSRSLHTETPDPVSIANALSMIAINCKAISPIVQLEKLLTIATSPDLSHNVLVYLFSPLSELIANYRDMLLNRSSEIAQLVFEWASQLFVDGEVEDQSDSLYILSCIDSIAAGDASDIPLESISPLLTSSSPGYAFASVRALLSIIDDQPEAASHHIADITRFLLENSKEEQHIAVREASLIALDHFIFVVNGGLVDFTTQILEACLLSLHSPYSVVMAGLGCLTRLITTLEIDESLIPKVFDHLFILFSINFSLHDGWSLRCRLNIQEGFNGFIINGMTPTQVMSLNDSLLRAFSGFIFAAQDLVLPFTDTLFEILFTFSDTSGYALEGLGLLLKSHFLSKDKVSVSLEKLASLLTSDNASYALSAISDSGASNHLAVEASIEALKKDVIPDSSEESDNILAYKKSALNILSHSKLLSEEDVSLVADQLLIEDPELKIATIKCIKHLAKGCSAGVEALVQVASLLDDDEPDVAVAALNALKNSLNLLPPSLIQRVNKFVFRSLHEDCEMELKLAIFKYLEKLSNNECFPLDEYSSYAWNVSKKSLEGACCSLVNCALIHGTDLTKLHKKAFVRGVFESISACDGSIPPYPLIAAGRLSLTDPSIASTYATHISDAVYTIIDEIDPFDVYARETITASLYCMLCIEKACQIDCDEVISLLFKETQPNEYVRDVVEFLTRERVMNREGMIEMVLRILSVRGNQFERLKLGKLELGYMTDIIRPIIENDFDSVAEIVGGREAAIRVFNRLIK